MTESDPWLGEAGYQYLHRNSPGQGEPSFESAEILEKVWGKPWGVSNDVGKLRAVLVSQPAGEWDVVMSGGEYVDKAQAWIGPGMMWYRADRNRPNLEVAQSQNDGLVRTLTAEVVAAYHLQEPPSHLTKAVFTRDPAVLSKAPLLRLLSSRIWQLIAGQTRKKYSAQSIQSLHLIQGPRSWAMATASPTACRPQFGQNTYPGHTGWTNG